MQRRIEPRSADDSLSGVVRCLYFADTFLRDGEARGPGREDGPELAIQEAGRRGDRGTQEGGKRSVCQTELATVSRPPQGVPPGISSSEGLVSEPGGPLRPEEGDGSPRSGEESAALSQCQRPRWVCAVKMARARGGWGGAGAGRLTPQGRVPLSGGSPRTVLCRATWSGLLTDSLIFTLYNGDF